MAFKRTRKTGKSNSGQELTYDPGNCATEVGTLKKKKKKKKLVHLLDANFRKL